MARPTRNILDNRTTLIEWSSGNPIYVGKAQPGTGTSALKWQIIKITWTGGNPVSVEYPSGNNSYKYSWVLRATYSYS